MADQLDASGQAGQWGQLIGALGAGVYPTEHVAPLAPIALEAQLGYVHLCEARLVDSSSGIPAVGTLVRCRLEHVGAWFLGRFDTPAQPSRTPQTSGVAPAETAPAT